MLKLDKIINVPSEYFGGIFSHESKYVDFNFSDGYLYTNTYDPIKGSWPDPIWTIEQQDSNLIKKYPMAFNADSFVDLMTGLVYSDGDYLYTCYFPDYGGNYDPKTPYRLYYAHDTDKLYQNVMDEWVFVGTKDHTNLLNAGNLTHDEIDDILGKLTRFKEVQW